MQTNRDTTIVIDCEHSFEVFQRIIQTVADCSYTLSGCEMCVANRKGSHALATLSISARLWLHKYSTLGASSLDTTDTGIDWTDGAMLMHVVSANKGCEKSMTPPDHLCEEVSRGDMNVIGRASVRSNNSPGDDTSTSHDAHMSQLTTSFRHTNTVEAITACFNEDPHPPVLVKSKTVDLCSHDPVLGGSVDNADSCSDFGVRNELVETHEMIPPPNTQANTQANTRRNSQTSRGNVLDFSPNDDEVKMLKMRIQDLIQETIRRQKASSMRRQSVLEPFVKSRESIAVTIERDYFPGTVSGILRILNQHALVIHSMNTHKCRRGDATVFVDDITCYPTHICYRLRRLSKESRSLFNKRLYEALTQFLEEEASASKKDNYVEEKSDGTRPNQPIAMKDQSSGVAIRTTLKGFMRRLSFSGKASADNLGNENSDTVNKAKVILRSNSVTTCFSLPMKGKMMH